jgi:hypothetical protein
MGTDVIIPAWFIWAAGMLLSVYMPWIVWLTTKVFDNDKAIAINNTHDQNSMTQFVEMKTELKQQISDVRTEINTRFDRFEDRVFDMMKASMK